jgi:hypothetical protein
LRYDWFMSSQIMVGIESLVVLINHTVTI